MSTSKANLARIRRIVKSGKAFRIRELQKQESIERSNRVQSHKLVQGMGRPWYPEAHRWYAEVQVVDGRIVKAT